MAAKKPPFDPYADDPRTLTRTPSGIEIAYWPGDGKPRSADKRRYAIRNIEPTSEIVYTPEGWKEAISVTTALGVLSKDALSWWGMRVGIKAVKELWDRGYLTTGENGRLLVTEGAVWQFADPRDGGNIEQVVKQLALTVNDTLSTAGERGTSVHGALESWAALGKLPDPEEFPPDEVDYIAGLRKFCDDMGDAWETEGIEVAVGSYEHGFAGRYDLRGRVTKDVNLVTRCLTKDGKSRLAKGPESFTVKKGTRLLVDAKTSKSIYASHLLQLEGYEGAGIEDGYDPTNMRAVLHISAHGLYQFRHAQATYEDFLAILRSYRAVKRTEEVL
jgi:hypothetical protein